MPKNYGDMEYQASTRAVFSGTGTNLLPGITFAGDLNTGIYTPGADQVGITTGGVLRLTINSEGALVITDVTAPGVTTNKLYSVSGALFWNGTDLTAGGGISNIVEDTTPQLGGNLDVQTFIITSSSDPGDINITAPTGASTTGGSINITAGNGYATGSRSGGGITILSGEGTNGGDGGNITIQSATGSNTATYSYAGDVNIIGGAGSNSFNSGRGGDINITSGIAGSASNSYAGRLTLSGGAGNSTNPGGRARIQGGTATSTGTGGDVDLISGGSSSGTSGVIRIKSGKGSEAGSLAFMEGNNNGNNFVKLTVPNTMSTDRTWSLPTDDPTTVAGDFLTTDSSGILSFAPAVPSITKYKTSTTSRASTTTTTDDPHLAGFVLDASSFYIMEGALFYTANSATPDLKMNWTKSVATVTDAFDLMYAENNASGGVREIASGFTSTKIIDLTTTGSKHAVVSGYISTSSAVTLDLQWAQNVSVASNVSLIIGSWIRFTKVG